jgi:hypothetical protein
MSELTVSPDRYTRRSIIKAASAGAGLFVLAACGVNEKRVVTPTISEPSPTITPVLTLRPTQISERDVEVVPTVELQYPRSYSEIGIVNSFVTPDMSPFLDGTKVSELPTHLQVEIQNKIALYKATLEASGEDTRDIYEKVLVNPTGDGVSVFMLDSSLNRYFVPFVDDIYAPSSGSVEFKIVATPSGFEECEPTFCNTKDGQLVPILTFGPHKEIVGWRNREEEWQSVTDTNLLPGVYCLTKENKLGDIDANDSEMLSLRDKLLSSSIQLYDNVSDKLVEIPTCNFSLSREIVTSLSADDTHIERIVVRHQPSGSMAVERIDSQGNLKYVVFPIIPEMDQLAVCGAPYIDALPNLFRQYADSPDGETIVMYAPVADTNNPGPLYGFAGNQQVQIVGTHGLGQLKVFTNSGKQFGRQDCAMLAPVDASAITEKTLTAPDRVRQMFEEMFSDTPLARGYLDTVNPAEFPNKDAIISMLVHASETIIRLANDTHDPRLEIAASLLTNINPDNQDYYLVDKNPSNGNPVNNPTVWTIVNNMYWSTSYLKPRAGNGIPGVGGVSAAGISTLIHELGHMFGQTNAGPGVDNEFSAHMVQISLCEAMLENINEIFPDDADNARIALNGLIQAMGDYTLRREYPVYFC